MTALSQKDYDLLVIGGGIYGACIFWEAVLRGLSVALVEQNDFASATSANSLKTIHGGLRYLQQADFQRMRISTFERTTLMRIAPHLVHPLPVIVPAYGHGLHGKEALAVAIRINDIVSFDRNRGVETQKHIPNGRAISQDECLALLPGLPAGGLTGAALYYDAQVFNSERLVLAFLFSAARRGGDLANYAKVVDLLHENQRVIGATVLDQITGQCFEVRAHMVINSTGGWLRRMTQLLPASRPSNAETAYSKAINVITRPIFNNYAVGLRSDERSGGLYFVAPWRSHSIIGTDYSIYTGHPEDLTVTPQEIDQLLQRINRAYPPANLTPDDVKFVHRGLLPLSGAGRAGDTVKLRQHPRIIDHRADGVAGILSVEGVKYTTARHVAAKVLDRVFKIWGIKSQPSVSATTPLLGGNIINLRQFIDAELAANPYHLTPESLSELISTYGSDYTQILHYLPDNHLHTDDPPLPRAILAAQIQFAVEQEMASKLGDFVFRRTGLATVEQPDAETLEFCAQAMGKILVWDNPRVEQEIREVIAFFDWRHA